MASHHAPSLATRAARLVIAATALLWLSASISHAPAPAKASVPAALEIADRALASTMALEDESPYQLIDPVGPGGISRKQAIGEVTASTMQGGLYNGDHYSEGYGQRYYVPAPQPPPGGYGGHPRPVPYGGYRR